MAVTKAYSVPRGRKPKRAKVKAGDRPFSRSVYPAPKTDALLVEAAAADHRSVSNYILHRAMVQLAKESKVALDELLPQDEYDALVLKKYRRKG